MKNWQLRAMSIGNIEKLWAVYVMNICEKSLSENISTKD